MHVVYDITHTTEYKYARPVELGEHRVMFRPRDSHDLRVLATDLRLTPPARDIRLIQDVHSNSVALVQPASPADVLKVVCLFTVEHTGTRALDLPLDPHARTYPFEYSAEDREVLDAFLKPCYEDPQDTLLKWARRFVRRDKGATGTRELLVEMNQFIREHFEYEPREEEGVQAPLETLARGKGTCRDFATLMIEAVKRLGYAARFVSGYVYTPDLEDASSTESTHGATHAWLQVYLPGAGWIPFDPTNNLIGGTELIRVGLARHAAQASPLSGSWTGLPEDYLGMTVSVSVRKRAPSSPST